MRLSARAATKSRAMNSEPDEKLLGRFSARNSGLHLVKLSAGYRIESWDTSDPGQTLMQWEFEALDSAVDEFLKRIGVCVLEE